MVGLALGAAFLVIFLLFTAIKICIDETKRHKTYAKGVADCLEHLATKLD